MADYEALERLARLRDSGVLTEEEFAAQKQRLLAPVEPTEFADTYEATEVRSNTARNLLLVGLVVAAFLVLGFWVYSGRQAQRADDIVAASSINPSGTNLTSADRVTEPPASKDISAPDDTEQSDAPEAIIPSMPSFQDYSVPTTDLIAPLQLAGHQDYRTRLRDAYKANPNFGANAVFVTWGCGTECSMGALVDRSTGLVIDSPVGGEDEPLLDYKTQHGSNLLLANWTHKYDKDSNEIKPECVFEAFEFIGGQFQSLTGFPKKEAGSCPD